MSILSDILQKLRKPKNKPETHYYRFKNEHFGVPANIALTIMDESFTVDQIKSASISTDQLMGYCKKLYEASEISKERYEDIIGKAPDLPAIPLTEDKKPSL